MSDILTKSPVSTSPEVSANEIEKVDRALIDQSAELPVLFFYTSAILWLLAATILGVIASFKMHDPEFLGGISWLTYGRVWPAFTGAFAYGWASQAGMGTGIWLCARLTRVALRRPAVLLMGGIFWNIGATVGVLAVLGGASQGIDSLEFPGFAQAILFIGFSLIAVWGVVMFRLRRPGHSYISLWYLVAGFFWFAWLYSAANLMITVFHIHGVVQEAVGAWYSGGFMTLWLTSLGLGTVYYFIPKVSGKPVHSYHLASLGFWSFAIFGGWTGMTRFIGGPFPAWLITASIVAGIMMLIPVVTVTMNFVLTLRGDFHLVYVSPTIRFVFLGAIAYAVASVIGIAASLRSVAGITQYTQFAIGHSQMLQYAFFSMVMFGAIYYIVPRLVGCEWLSVKMIALHFFGSVYGIGLIVFTLLIGGFVQGLAWNNPSFKASLVSQSILPFFIGRSIGWVLLMFGHFAFALHFLTMLLRLGRPSGRPTLFVETNGEGTH